MPVRAFCGKAPERISVHRTSGWAFRYKVLDDGRRQILNYALPADMLGLQGALMNEMEHSVEALTPLVLCVFPRAKLWDLYSRLPSLAFDITWLAAREEQLIDENLVSLGRRTALERVAYLLLHLFVRAEEAGLVSGGSIQFPFTQQHLADTLGMSLVHTNKTLKRLFVSKAVRWKDRVFEMVDRPRSPAWPGATRQASSTAFHLKWRRTGRCVIAQRMAAVIAQ